MAGNLAGNILMDNTKTIPNWMIGPSDEQDGCFALLRQMPDENLIYILLDFFFII